MTAEICAGEAVAVNNGYEVLIRPASVPAIANVKISLVSEVVSEASHMAHHDEPEEPVVLVRSDVSPFHLAVVNGDVEGSKRLLAERSDPHTFDSECQSLLRVAVEQGHLEVVRLFMEMFKGKIDFSYLYRDDTYAHPFYSPVLHIAYEKNQYDIVQLLLDHGANPNELDSDSCPCLYYAVKGKNLKMTQLFLEQNRDDINRVYDGLSLASCSERKETGPEDC